MATLLTGHLLQKAVLNTTKRRVKCHPTLLHKLMDTNAINPNKIETITATRYDSKWKPNIKTQIASNQEKAQRMEEEDHTEVKVYTDRSGHGGMISAAVVLYRGGREKTKMGYQLGMSTEHTVYEWEGVGMLLGIKLLSNEWDIRAATICVNNQAAITATMSTKL